MQHRVLAGLLIVVWVLAGCSGTKSTETAKVGDVERGEVLFRMGRGEAVPPCSTCHRLGPGGFGIPLGPSLEGIAVNAAARVAGMSAEDYIRDSILNPENFVVPGFRVSMYGDYAEHLTEQDIGDLTAYLMTLREAPE
jgi:mono/diheme cytochrome c family protein